MIDRVFIDHRTEDITPLIAGVEHCASGHRFGPAVRDYYLIHFVLSGRGVFTDKRGSYQLSAGQFFLIRPGESTVYSADCTDPWEYTWVGFTGRLAEWFDIAPSVGTTPARIGERLSALSHDGVNSPEIYSALILELKYHLSSNESEDSSTDRLRRIHRYVRYNYMQHISVNELAHTFGFERSYLFRIFKERYGIGLKEYITRVRMSHAAELIEEGYSVAEVASMVGYEDPFNFSKAFKSYYGISPSKYSK